MNPAMELVQPGGDRDFRGGLETFRRLASELSMPVIAKETGAGIGGPTARRLFDAGVRYADTSGAGGTSWVGVETLRAEGDARALGEALWDWGIPTAASVAQCVGAGLTTFATGGIATGLDVARALALGASAAGVARAALMALTEGGEAAVHALFDRVEAELRAVMLLVGARDVAALARTPKILTGELRQWVSEL
jgi:isopentenyl-diphosphate Delta-isomerase